MGSELGLFLCPSSERHLIPRGADPLVDTPFTPFPVSADQAGTLQTHLTPLKKGRMEGRMDGRQAGRQAVPLGQRNYTQNPTASD